MMLIDSTHAFYYYSSFARAREERFGFWLFEHTNCACVKTKPYTILIYPFIVQSSIDSTDRCPVADCYSTHELGLQGL